MMISTSLKKKIIKDCFFGLLLLVSASFILMNSAVESNPENLLLENDPCPQYDNLNQVDSIILTANVFTLYEQTSSSYFSSSSISRACTCVMNFTHNLDSVTVDYSVSAPTGYSGSWSYTIRVENMTHYITSTSSSGSFEIMNDIFMKFSISASYNYYYCSYHTGGDCYASAWTTKSGSDSESFVFETPEDPIISNHEVVGYYSSSSLKIWFSPESGNITLPQTGQNITDIVLYYSTNGGVDYSTIDIYSFDYIEENNTFYIEEDFEYMGDLPRENLQFYLEWSAANGPVAESTVETLIYPFENPYEEDDNSFGWLWWLALLPIFVIVVGTLFFRYKMNSMNPKSGKQKSPNNPAYQQNVNPYSQNVSDYQANNYAPSAYTPPTNDSQPQSYQEPVNPSQYIPLTPEKQPTYHQESAAPSAYTPPTTETQPIYFQEPAASSTYSPPTKEAQPTYFQEPAAPPAYVPSNNEKSSVFTQTTTSTTSLTDQIDTKNSSKTKTCSICGSSIPLDADKCDFCGW